VIPAAGEPEAPFLIIISVETQIVHLL